MIILAADDEQLALDSLSEAITLARPDAELHAFKNPSKLLAFAEKSFCDIAFLDIKMRNITGIELAKELKDIHPDIEIIFVTSYSEYALEAFNLHARGYLIKPVRTEDILEELHNLTKPAPLPDTHIHAQTFGSFELFIDGQPLRFKRSRSKEILAYLIDRRGATQTVAEIAAVIFEDKPYDRSMQKQMQVYISELRKSLREQKADHLLLRTRNSLAVDTSAFSCDYYDFIRMKPYATRTYHGEYMVNYAWAELTIGWLEKIK